MLIKPWPDQRIQLSKVCIALGAKCKTGSVRWHTYDRANIEMAM